MTTKSIASKLTKIDDKIQKLKDQALSHQKDLIKCYFQKAFDKYPLLSMIEVSLFMNADLTGPYFQDSVSFFAYDGEFYDVRKHYKFTDAIMKISDKLDDIFITDDYIVDKFITPFNNDSPTHSHNGDKDYYVHTFSMVRGGELEIN